MLRLNYVTKRFKQRFTIVLNNIYYTFNNFYHTFSRLDVAKTSLLISHLKKVMVFEQAATRLMLDEAFVLPSLKAVFFFWVNSPVEG